MERKDKLKVIAAVVVILAFYFLWYSTVAPAPAVAAAPTVSTTVTPPVSTTVSTTVTPPASAPVTTPGNHKHHVKVTPGLAAAPGSASDDTPPTQAQAGDADYDDWQTATTNPPVVSTTP